MARRDAAATFSQVFFSHQNLNVSPSHGRAVGSSRHPGCIRIADQVGVRDTGKHSDLNQTNILLSSAHKLVPCHP